MRGLLVNERGGAASGSGARGLAALASFFVWREGRFFASAYVSDCDALPGAAACLAVLSPHRPTVEPISKLLGLEACHVMPSRNRGPHVFASICTRVGMAKIGDDLSARAAESLMPLAMSHCSAADMFRS